jgi:nitroreductase
VEVTPAIRRAEVLAIDCALAAENLMLAAHAAGLGTSWRGFAQSWLTTSQGKKALDLPATYLPAAPIIAGHPQVLPPPVPPKAPEVRWIGPQDDPFRPRQPLL